MKQFSTYDGWTDPEVTPWDFTNVWHICNGTSYPRLRWEINEADFRCPYGVDMADFAAFAGAWGRTSNGANWNPAYDLHDDENIDLPDLLIFCERWMKEQSSKSNRPNHNSPTMDDRAVI